jgi:membrane-associated phospholipid phosphatase
LIQLKPASATFSSATGGPPDDAGRSSRPEPTEPPEEHSMDLTTPALATSDGHQRLLWTVFVGALACFGLDLWLVSRGTAQAFDDRILLWVHERTTPWLDRVFTVITDTGGVGRTVPVVAVTVFLLITRHKLEAGTLVVAAVVGQLLTYAIKAIVARDRPNLFFIANMPTDTSFPSGHALGSTILYGLLAIWLWHAGHRFPAGFLVVWALLVSFSRVYLGVHHPTDVLASLFIGVAFLSITLLVYGHLRNRVLS